MITRHIYKDDPEPQPRKQNIYEGDPPPAPEEIAAEKASQKATSDLGIKELDLEAVSGSTFNDVKLMADISNLAYYQSNKKNHTDLANKLRDKGYSFQIIKDQPSEMQCVVLSKGNDVFISFRGTKTKSHILKDINAALTNSGFMSGRVHKGFYKGFQDIWPSVSDTLDLIALKEKKSLKDYNFHFGGHSMGGSLTKIAALYTTKEWEIPKEQIKVVTFGDPRVFDVKQANEYDKLLGERTLRVSQVGKDPVPSALPGSLGFKHVGARFKVDAPKGQTPHKLKSYIASLKEFEKKGHDEKKKNFVDSRRISVFYPMSTFFRLIIDFVPKNLRYLIKKTKQALGVKSWHEKQNKPKSLSPAKTPKVKNKDQKDKGIT